MNTHHVKIYRVENGAWQFDHVLDVECESFGKACAIANGYNEGSTTDPKWLFLAVAESDSVSRSMDQ